jgi:GNAT superfamily N-acetyltransferase
VSRREAGGGPSVVERLERGRWGGRWLRAVGDRVKRVWVYDVVVAPSHRRRGVARALMSLLLDHPAVRGAREQWLHTFSAERLYASMGFAVVTRELTSDRVVMLRRPLMPGPPCAGVAPSGA